MKKFTLLFTFFLAIGFQQLEAQCSTCTPAFITCPPTGGLCNKLDTAYANHLYDKQINFYMPKVLTDPAVIAQCQCNWVELRVIRVTGVSGLPSGINYSLSQNGQYNVQGSDSVGCSHFCGTPLVPGLYPVTVYLEADVTAHGTPIGDVTQNNNAQQYKDTLLVLPDTSSGVSSFTYGSNGSVACDSINVNLNALYSAPAPNMTRYFWNFGNGQTSELKTPGTFTYRNSSGTQPDTFPVTLTTIFYTYIVKNDSIDNINGGYCNDIEEPTCSCLPGFKPDPYIKYGLLGFNNSGSYVSEKCSGISFNNLNLPIPLGTQTIAMEIWDKDNGPPLGSADDLIGTYNLNISLGNIGYSDGNASGHVRFDTIAGTTITETLNVIVNPFPANPSIVASSDTFCSVDSVRISLNHTYSGCAFEWYRDTVFLTSVVDSFFYTNQGGNYKVKITNQLTGCQSVSGWKAVTKALSPASTVSIIFTGPSLFVTPFSTDFAVDWYYNGNLVTGQNGKFLSFLGSGEYRAEVYNISYPLCRTSSSSDTIVSGISEVADNSIYGLCVLPNPNRGKFTLKFTTEEALNIRIHIQNVVGQSIFERNLENYSGEFTEDMDITQWSKGVYFIGIETPKGKLNKKVVVE